MVTDKDMQMRGAIAAAMTHFGEGSTEYEQLKAEVQLLNQFNSFISAAQAGLIVSPPEVSEEYKPIGILALWREITSPDAAAVPDNALTKWT